MSEFHVISYSTPNKQQLSQSNHKSICVFQAISDIASWDCTGVAQGFSETKQNSAVQGRALRTHPLPGCSFKVKRRRRGWEVESWEAVVEDWACLPPATWGRSE